MEDAGLTLSLWYTNTAPSKCMAHEPALQHVLLLVLHESGNLGEKNSVKACN